MSGELIRLNHGTVLQDRLCIISEVQHLEDPRFTMKNGIRWIIMRGFWALCNAFGDYSQYIQITKDDVTLKIHGFCLILFEICHNI